MGTSTGGRPAAERLALALRGAGGPPGRPGVIHYVGTLDPAGENVTARGAVVLASADVVIVAAVGRAAAAVTLAPPDAEVVEVAPGDAAGVLAASASDRVTARLVAGRPEEWPESLLDEVEEVARAAAIEVDPVPAVPSHLPPALTAWQEARPLHGRRVLVPRSRAQASALAMHVRGLGGLPIEAPVLDIRPGDTAALRAAVRDLAAGAFDAVAFTSPNGVAAVADALAAAGLDARAFASLRFVAAVGPGTAASLHDRIGLRADVVPDTATTAALAEVVPPGPGRVLLPRADIATDTLPDGLRAAGWEPVEVTAYVTARAAALAPDVLASLRAGGIDLVAVASSSTARNLAALLDGVEWSARVVSIGPVTSTTCREVGIEVAVEADPHTLDGLVAALVDAARS